MTNQPIHFRLPSLSKRLKGSLFPPLGLILVCCLSSIPLDAIPAHSDRAKTKWFSKKGEPRENLPPEPLCRSKHRNIELGARYLAGEGIGFSEGYTTIETFLSPPFCYRSWIPYLDLKGHLFNDSNPAANAGFGARYIGGDSLIYGASVYYDYRKTDHFHYNQIGAGVELLASFWGLSINGYIPLGKRESKYYDQKTETGRIFEFSSFQNNQIFFVEGDRASMSRKKEFSLQGIDAHVLFSLIEKKLLSFQIGGGPYFYFSDAGKQAFGGEADFTIRIAPYFSLRAQVSYDNLYDFRSQGEVALILPLGKLNSERSQCPSRFCSLSSFLDAKLSSGQKRREIIPAAEKKETQVLFDTSTPYVAIDPATGDPFHILFVDNETISAEGAERGASQGTIYSSLSEALTASSPRDIIYIYPGDGTTEGLNAFGTPFTALSNQKIWGSSTLQILMTAQGPLSIPPQTSPLPKLTANPNQIIFIGADSNEFSGLHFIALGDANSAALAAPNTPAGITNMIIRNNRFDGEAASGGIGKTGNGRFEGTLLIENNIFNMTNGVAISAEPQIGSADYTISQNTFSLDLNSQAFVTNGVPGFGASFSISFDSNEITSENSGRVILARNLIGASAIVQNNIFRGNPASGCVSFNQESGDVSLNLLGNQFLISSPLSAIAFSENTGSSLCLKMLNNQSNGASPNYLIAQSLGAVTRYETTTPGSIPTNVPSTFEGDGTPVPPGTCNY